jgi:hypothetical protein
MVAPLPGYVRAKLRDQIGITDKEIDEYQSLIEERAYAGPGPEYAAPATERREARLRELAHRINPALKNIP